MPATVVMREVEMLAARLKRRRTARRARNRFHVRAVEAVEVEDVGVEMVVGGVRVEIVSALRGGVVWLAATVDSARLCEVIGANAFGGSGRAVRKAIIGDALDEVVGIEDA